MRFVLAGDVALEDLRITPAFATTYLTLNTARGVPGELGDTANPLADVRIRGRMRKVVIYGSKTGMYYILDRETGEPLIGIDERPVPPITGEHPEQLLHPLRTGAGPTHHSRRFAPDRSELYARVAPVAFGQGDRQRSAMGR